jgi:hypothetical protein
LIPPLTFFNLFWHTHSLILLNKENPLKVLNYLLNLELKSPQLYYLLENLLISFNRSLYPEFCPKEDGTELSICLEFIIYECEKLCQVLYPDNEVQNLLFNFSIIKKHAALIPNDNDKLIYLISVKTDYLQYVNSSNTPLHTAFDVLCDLEIKKIRKIIKLNSFSIPLIAQSSLSDEYRQGTALSPSDAALSHPDSASSLQSKRQSDTPSPSSLSPVYFSPQSDRIKNFIASEICAIDTQEWNYIFKSKKDFMAFLNIFSDFFTGRKTPPDFNMILQPRCKTRFCSVLNRVYQHFKDFPLKRDNEFLSLLQNLSVFKNQNHSQIYHDIVRF